MVRATSAVEEDRGKHHGGHDGHRVGLEEVGGHAGAVADIVAHVVGDGRGVAGVVLRNAGLDLADQIAAHVGALGEDAAAETGEDGDERGAEAERHQRVDDLAILRIKAQLRGEDPVIDGDAKQRQAGHQQTGDRAGAESDGEAGAERLRGGLRRAHIGAHRDQHADEPCHARQHRTDGEADRGGDRQEPPGEQEDHHADDGDGRILPRQVGGGAFADGGGDLLHARVARIGSKHGLDRPHGVDDAEHAAGNREIERYHSWIFPWKPPRRVGRENAAALTGQYGTPAGY